MAKHRFIKKHLDDGSWDVYCESTTGSFNTNIWKNYAIKRQICPCCKEEIKNGE